MNYQNDNLDPEEDQTEKALLKYYRALRTERQRSQLEREQRERRREAAERKERLRREECPAKLAPGPSQRVYRGNPPEGEGKV